MAQTVKMPQIGQDIQTGRIVEWAVAENQPVTKGQILVSVESDKAIFEVEAPVTGVLLKILRQNGEDAEVFSPIALIGEAGESGDGECGDIILNSQPVTALKPSVQELSFVSPDSPPLSPSPSHSPIPPAPSSSPDRLIASPAARRRAGASGFDLGSISGSGPGGRIIVRDLPDPRSSGDVDVIFSPMRRRIAERLVLSKRSIPHFYLFRDVDCTTAAAWRSELNERQDEPITWTDLIIKATALALVDFKRLNAHVKEDRLILKSEVNIGLAVALEDGLLVPVLARADRLGIREINTKTRELAAAARQGIERTTQPSTFTISNLGMCGVDRFIPIINPPECGILGVGSVQKRPTVLDGELAVRDVLTLCLACDHRAVDGAYAAAFLNAIKRRMEDPSQLGGDQK